MPWSYGPAYGWALNWTGMRTADRPRLPQGAFAPFFLPKIFNHIQKIKAASYTKDKGRKLRLHFFAGPNTQEKKTGRYIDRSRVGKVLNQTKYPTIYVFIYVNVGC